MTQDQCGRLAHQPMNAEAVSSGGELGPLALRVGSIPTRHVEGASDRHW